MMINLKLVCLHLVSVSALSERSSAWITTAPLSTRRTSSEAAGLPHFRASKPLRRQDAGQLLTQPPSAAALRAASPSSLVLLDKTVALASFSATVKLLCSIALGAWAARKRVNRKLGPDAPTILDGPAIASLSRMTYWVFQPAFLLCSVTRTFAMAAATSGGSGGSSLTGSQLALMPLVAVFQIGTGALVGQLFTRQKKDAEGPEDQQSSIVRMCTTFANSGPLPLLFADALFSRTNSAIQAQVVACISFYLLAWSPLFWSFGKVILGTTEKAAASTSALKRFGNQVKQFLSPPVIGSILGIVIGANPALRRFLLQGPAFPLYSAMHTLGTAYLPAALLVLAGSLASKKKSTDTTATDTGAGMTVRSISTIAFSRFVLAPCWALACLWGCNKLNLLGAMGTQARAILSFCILMEGCMPPAQNSVILLNLVGLTGAATSMAQTLTVLYGLAVLPVTLLLSACLSISGITQFL